MSSIDEQALEWAARQDGRTLEPAERAGFDAWYAASPRHQGAYLRARALQYTLNQVKVQDNLKPAGPARADVVAVAAPAPRAHWRRAGLVSGALAAGAAVLAAWLYFPSGTHDAILQTAQGEIRKVPLPDRSVASIAAGSTLEVHMSRSQRRMVLKQGEAWFQVAKDKSRPFVVEADDIRARAVGTAFGLRRHKDGAEVYVTEGVIEVWTEDGGARVRRIAAGEQAYVPYRAQTFQVASKPDDMARKLAWRDRKLVFASESLDAAVTEFNRYNARQIVIADAGLRGKVVVGQYPIDQPERFAEDIRVLMKVPVAVTPEQIRIGADARR